MPQREWEAEFLASLSLTPNVTEACRQAGVTRQAAYQYRAEDSEFAARWDAALDESTDELVGEAYRRAKEGVEEPVYFMGRVVGKVRKYSDTMLIFLLKSHRRKVYGDKLDADLTTAGQAMVTHFYVPENDRDAPDPGADGPPPAGPPDGVPGHPG